MDRNKERGIRNQVDGQEPRESDKTIKWMAVIAGKCSCQIQFVNEQE